MENVMTNGFTELDVYKLSSIDGGRIDWGNVGYEAVGAWVYTWENVGGWVYDHTPQKVNDFIYNAISGNTTIKVRPN